MTVKKIKKLNFQILNFEKTSIFYNNSVDELEKTGSVFDDSSKGGLSMFVTTPENA